MITFRIAIIVANNFLLDAVHQVGRTLPCKIVINEPTLISLESFAEQLKHEQPDILFLELGTMRHSLPDVMHRIEVQSPGTRVVAVNATPDSDLILLALRSGVSEFLVPPFQRTWEVAIDKLAAEIASEKMQSQTGQQSIGLLSVKGGCGATTIACHLAAGIRRQTRSKTLLLDLDLEAGSVGFLLRASNQYSIYDALDNIHRLDENLWRALVSLGPDNLDVLRSHMDLPPDLYPTAENLARLLEFIKPMYNWTILDLGRGLGYLTLSALRKIDYTYLVTTFELPALRQAKHLVKVLSEQAHSKDRLRLIINRMPKNAPVSINDLERLIGLPVYFTLSNQYHPLMQAYESGQLLDGSVTLGQEFQKLAGKTVGASGGSEGPQKKSFLASIFSSQSS